VTTKPVFWLGRQPILDLTSSTIGYELLFRSDSANAAKIDDDKIATASVINHAFGELGIASVLGEGRGFINFDADLLLSEVVELLPPERTVIEILEHTKVTPEVIARCRELRELGFSFALDDIVQIGGDSEQLLPLVDIVKVDVLGSQAEQLKDLVARARGAGRMQLLAEKVDTREQADRCRELGFDLFQGYFFAKPVVMQGKRNDPSRRVLMQLLQQILADTDTGAIEETFKQAPDLSYKLMRLVNSVAIGARSPVQSLPHAIKILGRAQLQRWVQVLLFTSQGSTGFQSPLLNLAAARGKFMELLAIRMDDQRWADRAFMTGILSLLDTLLEMPMNDVLAQLSLPDDVCAALLHRRGPLGQYLLVIEALERADGAEVSRMLASGKPCTTAELAQLQITSLCWANRLGQVDSSASTASPARAARA
jgi:EAL and modified HD-GYP domain-containing signal transduction protein